ncbi:hypothetical protein L2E82_00869 [Cichorium intybus]|uniref:Uncharacterized protein n=1 Tax=Cichorium intybus TaxID=13427 RepID=A0ACB9GYL0_CICIN|nr:hypothetical protein L2E82_00869 [Cichorium intybus]
MMAAFMTPAGGLLYIQLLMILNMGIPALQKLGRQRNGDIIEKMGMAILSTCLDGDFKGVGGVKVVDDRFDAYASQASRTCESPLAQGSSRNSEKIWEKYTLFLFAIFMNARAADEHYMKLFGLQERFLMKQMAMGKESLSMEWHKGNSWLLSLQLCFWLFGI